MTSKVSRTPRVDWMTIHDGDKITIQRDPEGCVYIEVSSASNSIFKLHLTVYSTEFAGPDTVPEVVMLPDCQKDEEASVEEETA